MNTGELIQKWVITNKLGLYKNEHVKVPVTLYCHHYFFPFFNKKIYL